MITIMADRTWRQRTQKEPGINQRLSPENDEPNGYAPGLRTVQTEAQIGPPMLKVAATLALGI